MVIQAVRTLGEGNTGETDIEHLSMRLTEQDKNLLLAEGKRSAVWVYDVIRQICNR
jgi:hypothetical protein